MAMMDDDRDINRGPDLNADVGRRRPASAASAGTAPTRRWSSTTRILRRSSTSSPSEGRSSRAASAATARATSARCSSPSSERATSRSCPSPSPTRAERKRDSHARQHPGRPAAGRRKSRQERRTRSCSTRLHAKLSFTAPARRTGDDRRRPSRRARQGRGAREGRESKEGKSRGRRQARRTSHEDHPKGRGQSAPRSCH